jgi:murein DD-endopeptidase MepM/ murein hydrolase activator NlpD
VATSTSVAPTAAPTTSIAAPASTAVPRTTPPSVAGGAHVFPIQPAGVASYGRAHHDYPATDIFAPCGATVVAVTAGSISEIAAEDVWDPAVNDGATRGGLAVTLVGDDGVRYYGSHLASIDPAIAVGARVEAGTPLGVVGNTGNARGIACHLHFGLSPPCGVGDWQVRRGTIGPAPYLDSWRDGDASVSAIEEISAWRAAHPAECP